MRRAYTHLISQPKDPMIWTIDTTKGDGIASFALPTRSGFAYSATIDWGDGTTSRVTSATDPNRIHSYGVGGTYQVSIQGKFEAVYFNNTGDKDKFISLDAWGDVGIADTGLTSAWWGCINATSFEPVIPYTNITTLIFTWYNCLSATALPEVNNLVNVNNLRATWTNCSSATTFPEVSNLTSVTTLDSTWSNCSLATTFPSVNTLTLVTTLLRTWRGCSSATTFPEVSNLTAVTTLQESWKNCSLATAFPNVNTLTLVTTLFDTWRDCSSATTFPEVSNLTSVTNIRESWRGCVLPTAFPDVSNLTAVTNVIAAWAFCSNYTTIPANVFNNFIASSYNSVYSGTNLTQASIDNVLTSIDTSGVINGTFNQSGGSAPSLTGQTVIDSLRAKGWTVTVTGGY